MAQGGQASLQEVLGSVGGTAAQQGRPISMDDLPGLLGDGMPKIEHTPVGRFRLMNALQQRFGDNFRSLPGMAAMLKDFDSEAETQKLVNQFNHKRKQGR